MIFVDGFPIEFGRYPNGEVVVPKLLPVSHAVVRLHWESDQDLVNLMFVRAMVDPSSDTAASPSLFIDYMPYSRMDRAQDGHCFSLKHVAALILAMKWRTIRVVEPHSDATLQQLRDNARPVWATAKLLPLAMEMFDFNTELDYIVLPDKGAYGRYSELCAETLDKSNIVVMGKKRDFETGKITGLEVASRTMRGLGMASPGSKALIIDDLSSRGGTFIQAADILRGKLDCSRVGLLVTHMEPVGLTGDLKDKLDLVFCTDTMLTPPYTVPDNFRIFTRGQWNA